MKPTLVSTRGIVVALACLPALSLLLLVSDTRVLIGEVKVNPGDHYFVGEHGDLVPRSNPALYALLHGSQHPDLCFLVLIQRDPGQGSVPVYLKRRLAE